MDTYIGVLVKTRAWMEFCFCGVILLLGYLFWNEFRPEVTSKIKGISSQILWDIFWIIIAANFILTSQAMPVILCFVLIVVMMRRKRNQQMIEMRDNLTEQKYEQLKYLNQEMQILRHDWKNHLLAMKSLVEEKEYEKLEDYLADMTEMASMRRTMVVSGHSMMDAVLNYKAEQAMTKNISIDMKSDWMQGLKLAEKDIFIMLANLLDNALEASEKVTDSPWINVNITRTKNMLFIKISNSISKRPGKMFERFVTDKVDTKQHGFGILSVERIVKRYDGEFETFYNENRFEASIAVYDAFD